MLILMRSWRFFQTLARRWAPSIAMLLHCDGLSRDMRGKTYLGVIRRQKAIFLAICATVKSPFLANYWCHSSVRQLASSMLRELDRQQSVRQRFAGRGDARPGHEIISPHRSNRSSTPSLRAPPARRAFLCVESMTTCSKLSNTCRTAPDVIFATSTRSNLKLSREKLVRWSS